MLCLVFIPSLTLGVIFAPPQPPCALSQLKSNHVREKKLKQTLWVPRQKCSWQQKCKQFSHLDYKSLKYIAGPGKSKALEYLQLKITNNYHPHFAIFNNLLHKAFLMKEPL